MLLHCASPSLPGRVLTRPVPAAARWRRPEACICLQTRMAECGKHKVPFLRILQIRCVFELAGPSFCFSLRLMRFLLYSPPIHDGPGAIGAAVAPAHSGCGPSVWWRFMLENPEDLTCFLVPCLQNGGSQGMLVGSHNHMLAQGAFFHQSGNAFRLLLMATPSVTWRCSKVACAVLRAARKRLAMHRVPYQSACHANRTSTQGQCRRRWQHIRPSRQEVLAGHPPHPEARPQRKHPSLIRPSACEETVPCDFLYMITSSS